VTANKPAFTAAQHEKVLESLRDMKAWFEANRSFDKGPVKPVWRLTKGLNGKLGVTNDLGPQLVDVLRTCDAMITTPSTTIL